MSAVLALGPPVENVKPRGAGQRTRGEISKAFSLVANVLEDTPQHLAAQQLSRRFGFAIPTARVVAHLAGLGGAQ